MRESALDLAHNLFHLLAEGGSVVTTVAALVGFSGSEESPALVSSATIRVLQFVLLAAGVAASMYAARRITDRRYSAPSRRRATLTPFLAVIAGLSAVNVGLFLLPMAHRM